MYLIVVEYIITNFLKVGKQNFTAPKNNAERIKTFQKDTPQNPLEEELKRVAPYMPKKPTEDDINREYSWD